MKNLTIVATIAFALAAPAMADGFKRIKDEKVFVNAVSGKKVTFGGGHFTISASGDVKGKIKKGPVVGKWVWQKGFWCRNLNIAGKVSGTNCQVVKISGNEMKFIRDQGKGDDSTIYTLK